MWSFLLLVFIVFVVIKNVRKLLIAHDFSLITVNIISINRLSGVESMVYNLTAREMVKRAASANILQSLLDAFEFNLRVYQAAIGSICIDNDQ